MLENYKITIFNFSLERGENIHVVFGHLVLDSHIYFHTFGLCLLLCNIISLLIIVFRGIVL